MDVLHVAVDVEDIDAMAGFYEDVLGLAKTREFEVDGTYNYCVGGESPAELQFCEVEAKEPPAGINHISIAVEDVEAVIETATSEWGSEVERDPTTVGEEAKIAFVSDPEGYSVELIEEL